MVEGSPPPVDCSGFLDISALDRSLRLISKAATDQGKPEVRAAVQQVG